VITEVITTFDQLSQISDDWTDLLQRMENVDIFDTWEWTAACLETMLKPEAPLFIVTVRDHNQLVGIAPLCLYTKKVGFLKIRTLKFINYGTAAYSSCYLHKDYNYNSLMKLIVQELSKHRSDWDYLELKNFNSKNKAALLTWELLGNIYNTYVEEGQVNTYINYKRYSPMMMNKRKLKEIEAKEKKLLREHQVNIVINQSYEERLWIRHAELHREKWGDGLFHHSSYVNFMNKLLPSLDGQQRLSYSYLEIDGQIQAINLCFFLNEKVYGQLMSYSPDYSKWGIGLILSKQLVDYFHREGKEEYDFLNGSEPYKFYWTDSTRMNYNLYACNHNSKKALLSFYTQLKLYAGKLRSERRVR
jgi:CelD/BcsL family acetyltransferase involved in cellulose biosynthesis